jgi:hypothetical protein
MKVANGTTTRRRRSWSTTSSIPTRIYVGSLLQLFFRCTTCLVVMIHDLLLISFLGWHCRSSPSVAYPFPYSGTRAILHGSWSRSSAIVICDGYKRWSGLRHVIKKISSYSLSVMYATCLDWLKLPLGLTVHIVSRLSKEIEVICSDILLINGIDLVKIEAFWMARIWVDLINPMRFS